HLPFSVAKNETFFALIGYRPTRFCQLVGNRNRRGFPFFKVFIHMVAGCRPNLSSERLNTQCITFFLKIEEDIMSNVFTFFLVFLIRKGGAVYPLPMAFKKG